MFIGAHWIGATLVAAVALAAGVALGQDLAPGPVPRAQSTFAVLDPPNPAELVQAVLDFPVGTAVAPHTHGGAAYITMLEGELTVQGPDGTHTYRAGDAFMEHPGHVYAAYNPGDRPASLVVTYLVSPGVPVTTPVTK